MTSFLAWGFDRLLGLPPAAARDVRRRKDLRIPMPDGVITLADWYRPSGSDPTPMPVVLVRTPYGHQTLLGRLLGSVLARRGLQVVIQSVRGTFGSGGEYWPMHQERDDGVATVAWLRDQPWCDGRIATAGPSYLGHTQWAIGPYLDEPLEAMCVSVTTSDFPRTFYPDGNISLYSLLSWSSLIGTQEDGTPLSNILGRRKQEQRNDAAMASLPLRDADRIAIGKPVRFWQEVIEHAEPGDDFWKPINHRPLVAKLTTPTTMVTGWYDLFLPAQLDDFRDLQRAGRSTRITIGPWAHADPGNIKTMLADTANFLVAHLGGNTSELNRAPVRVYLQHADRWLDFPTWPPEEPRPTPIHLQDGRKLDWSTPTTGEPDEFDYDPADPTPSTGGPLLNGPTKQRDNTAIEARKDVLTYTGERLARDLDLVGDLEATIFLRTELGHGDLFVRLCDVDGRGVSRNVCDGMIRLRAGDIEPAEDGSFEVRLPMYPTGYRFRRGHRLRVQIAAGAFPRFSRNHGTEDPIADATAMRRNHYEILHDAAHPSRVVLPVLSD
ncbi:MAG TPA: CocE/NonD family hydrolase [Pseudonocardiaceae bacterium]